MYRLFHLIFFYLVVIPLSWLGGRWTYKLYQDTRYALWPEESTILLAYRDAAITAMIGLGYMLQSRGDQIVAYNFQTEFALAEDTDLTERWRKAMIESHHLSKEKYGE